MQAQNKRVIIGPIILKSFSRLAVQPLAETMKYTLKLKINKHFSNHI